MSETHKNQPSGAIPVHLASGAAGFIVATGVALASGIPAAWATPLYFFVGWPVMCAVIYLLARAYPVRAWRWTLSMMLGQVFSSIFFGGGPMMPVAMAYVTLLSVPQFYAGSLGARAGLKRAASEQQNA
ncbi:MAG: hypothetical protein KKD00_06705 [Gammaproteobacteria bacterium]|nr:hypothetical protein [Gammaproteobacteria bacterium]